MTYEKILKELFYMQQVYATLFSVSNKIQTAGDKVMGNLSSRQYMAILAIPHLSDGETNLNNIAEKMGTTKQNIRQLISALEKKNYVAVLPNENDKRALNVQVTEPGLMEMIACSELGTMFMADLFREFTENELQIFWKLLKKLYRFDGREQNGFEAEPSIDYAISDGEQQKMLQQFWNRRNNKLN